MSKTTLFSFLGILCVTAMGVSACAADPEAYGASPKTARSDISNLRVQQVAYTSASTKPAAPAAENAYGLNVGDKVKITTYGHPDLSGEFMVEGNGGVNLPLVGSIKAVGKSQLQLQEDIRRTLASGYLVDPKVSVEVANLRQFYIVGEVGAPGAYDYVPSLNILKAVAIAGGFTRRAVTDEFTILRTESGSERKMDAREETVVLPGDTIRVDERFF